MHCTQNGCFCINSPTQLMHMMAYEAIIRFFVPRSAASISYYIRFINSIIPGRLLSEVYNFPLHQEFTITNGTEKCTIISTFRHKYLDTRCNSVYPFICKKPLTSLQWNKNCNAYNLGKHVYN